MYGTDSPEQAALREVVRDFCRVAADAPTSKAPTWKTLAWKAPTWKRLTGELGLTGLAIGERYGGMGGGLAEVVIAAEELGRVLLPVPYLSTALAGVVLSESARELAAEPRPDLTSPLSDVASLLSDLASGALAAGFVFGGDIAVREGRLSGVAEHVLDGAEAGVFLVGAGGSLYAVRVADVAVTATETLDQSRSQATVTFADSPALVTGADPDRAQDLMRVLLAAESVAAAEHCLDVTVAYLKDRRQFGRPIGSFQALKHRCADLVVEVASARATAWAAVEAATGSPPGGFAVLAPLAKRYCVDVFGDVAAEMIQLHGGIGFTWEHEAHRYLKRAKTSQLLLGSPAQLRRLVARRAGLY